MRIFARPPLGDASAWAGEFRYGRGVLLFVSA